MFTLERRVAPRHAPVPLRLSSELGAVARCGGYAHRHSVQVRDAEAPLVGIARLAASSPSAESDAEIGAAAGVFLFAGALDLE